MPIVYMSIDDLFPVEKKEGMTKEQLREEATEMLFGMLQNGATLAWVEVDQDEGEDYEFDADGETFGPYFSMKEAIEAQARLKEKGYTNFTVPTVKEYEQEDE